MATELRRDLQDKLGHFYEVIFEVEGLQIRRRADRAFIAKYDPQHGTLRAGPHVQFPGQDTEDKGRLAEEGRRRMGPKLDEWRDFGFEQTDDGHVITIEEAHPGPPNGDVPRYIVPMAIHVDSVDDAVEAIEWVRTHRKF